MRVQAVLDKVERAVDEGRQALAWEARNGNAPDWFGEREFHGLAEAADENNLQLTDTAVI